jgi:C1A family cysteine protease
MASYLVFSLAIATASVSATLYTENSTSQMHLFENFKSKYERKYISANEESHRFNLFLENLKLVDARNAESLKAGSSAVHGITKFSDMSQKEFENLFLTADPSKRVHDSLPSPKPVGLIDWTGKLATPVQDQGLCSSCWAFSASQQIESDAIRVGLLTTSDNLSPEQLVQCDADSSGCSWGWTERAYNYVTEVGGLALSSDYPYTSANGTTGTCSADTSNFKIGVGKYFALEGETSMATHVQSTGPLSVCLNSQVWNTYTGGIVTYCPGTYTNHCVQVFVGLYHACLCKKIIFSDAVVVCTKK